MARKTPPTDAAPDAILTSPTAARIAGLERVYFARLIREGKGQSPLPANCRYWVVHARRVDVSPQHLERPSHVGRCVDQINLQIFSAETSRTELFGLLPTRPSHWGKELFGR
jgi:hypothetical protein